MPKAKNQERLKNLTNWFQKLLLNAMSHLFQIDETFPVNVPCRQKQFLIPRPVRIKQLIPISI